MLSAWLHKKDLGKTWAPAADGWEAGSSAIRPYQHAALHAGMFASKKRTAVIIRERVGGQPEVNGSFSVTSCSERALDEVLAEARHWPLEFLEVLITRRDDGNQVTFRCGQWGTAPVYFLVRDGGLHVNWDVTDLYKYLPSTILEPGFAAQFILGLSHPYSSQTIFSGVSRLTERARAVWRPPFETVKISYPSPQSHSRAKRLKSNAHVVETFREILSASMKRWLPSSDHPVAMELSGGLDSSIVAVMAATITTKPVKSYGMIMPGVLARHQRARRDETIKRFSLSDSNFQCIDHPPFNPKSPRVIGTSVVPWAEFYEEAVGTMLGKVAQDGVGVIFTGMGGDELCSYQESEVDAEEGDSEDGEQADVELSAFGSPYPPFVTDLLKEADKDRDFLINDAPQSLMDMSSVESATAVSTLYLKNKVWPISPLCTPELVEFCRKLPFDWRHERLIERKVLTSFGCSPLVAYPKPETLENFCGVMDYALRDASSGVISKLFRDSRLAEQGFVDKKALMATYEQYRAGDPTYSDQLLAVVVLELTIRSLEKNQKNGPAKRRAKS